MIPFDCENSSILGSSLLTKFTLHRLLVEVDYFWTAGYDWIANNIRHASKIRKPMIGCRSEAGPAAGRVMDVNQDEA